MNRKLQSLVAGLVVIGACVRLLGGDTNKPITVATLPPVVVTTVPASGELDVDAAKVTEVKAIFSKKMTNKSWSWSEISKETTLPLVGEPKYDADGRTCVVKVKLEPGKTYVTWLNSEKFRNFKDADGNAAVPYLLVFQTKPAK